MNILKVKQFLFGSIMFCLATMATSKDLGVFGETLPIAEQDLLAVIAAKLQTMQATGELEQHQYYLQQKVRERVLQPKENRLPETTKAREFYYDPSIVVEEDLVDHNGKVFRHKGERINPLDTYSFREPWLFFDGNSPQQQQFALTQAKQEKIKLIMIAGSPLDLMRQWQMPIYFDQQGLFIEKFKITQVPARIEQDDKKLKITEIKLSK